MDLFQGNRNVRPELLNGPVVMLHDMLRPDECAAIRQMMKELPADQATVDDGDHRESVRRSDVRWLHFNDPNPVNLKAANFVLSTMAQANQDFFGFELTELEPIQLTHYRDDVQGTYDWHQDDFFRRDTNVVRKLTIVIQLSPPDDYDGGGLDLQVSNVLVNVPSEQGLAVLFPAPTLHRVVPVTRGNRYSLVGWGRGPNFR